MKIPPFNPADKDITNSLRYVMHNAPVQNLTEEEFFIELLRRYKAQKGEEV